MQIPTGDRALSSEWLTRALQSSVDWREGSVRLLDANRIGETYGFIGRIHRITVEAESGRMLSLVVKTESAEAVERELLVRRHLGDRLHGTIALCYFGTADALSARGVLILEDIAPAVQGDVLGGCTREGAEAAVRALARLHAVGWPPSGSDHTSDLPLWPAAPMDAERWSDRLTRAHERFPEILVAELVARLRELPAAVEVSLARLRQGPAAWIHADAHLDNILWRLDGSAVLLDWADAAIGPPAVDVALFLAGGVAPSWRESLISAYAEELVSSGVECTALEAEKQVALALPHLLQGAVGWAGRDDLGETGRQTATCRSLLRSALAWADATGLQAGGMGS